MDLSTVTRGALWRRLAVWVVFVVFCTLGMVDLTYASAPSPISQKITYFQLLLAVAFLFAVVPLLRIAGERGRSLARTMCRLVLAYLLYEALVVLPVSLWLGSKLTLIIGTMGVRAAWLLFPIMLLVCSDEKLKRLAGQAVVVAAVLLAIWGVYLALTGGGGYYIEFGDVRYRILAGQGSMLFAWLFVLALSGVVSRKYTVAFLGLSAIGLVLTNHRSDLIAFAVAGVVCLVMAGQFQRVLPAVGIAAVVAAIVALIWGAQVGTIFGYTVSHLFDITSGNGADRLVRWRMAWDFFVAHPFNDYVWSWRYYLTSIADVYQPHNFALEIAGQEGVAGLLFYGAVFWTTLRNAWDWGRRDAEARALIGWLVFYILFSLLNANHYLPTSMPILVAAMAALASRVDWLSVQPQDTTAPACPIADGTVTAA